MRFNLRSGIPSRPKGKSHAILAKGPQDCAPLTPEEFSAAIAYVAKAFLSAAIVPKEFFSGIALSANLSQDSAQRTLLAAYAHFKSDPNKSLNFYFRYIALLKMAAQPGMSDWVTRDVESEYALFSAEIISVAAKHPLLPSGQFAHESFVAALNALHLPEPVAHDKPAGTVAFSEKRPERLAA